MEHIVKYKKLENQLAKIIFEKNKLYLKDCIRQSFEVLQEIYNGKNMTNAEIIEELHNKTIMTNAMVEKRLMNYKGYSSIVVRMLGDHIVVLYYTDPHELHGTNYIFNMRDVTRYLWLEKSMKEVARINLNMEHNIIMFCNKMLSTLHKK